MVNEDDKALVRRFIDEVMNTGDTSAIPGFCVPGSMFAGGIAGQITSMKTAFPDLHFAVDDIFAEEGRVAVRVSVSGTNKGPLVGLPAFGRLDPPVPPTGKSITHGGLYIFKVKDGQIVSYLAEWDQLGLLRQLGWTVSPPGAA